MNNRPAAAHLFNSFLVTSNGELGTENRKPPNSKSSICKKYSGWGKPLCDWMVVWFIFINFIRLQEQTQSVCLKMCVGWKWTCSTIFFVHKDSRPHISLTAHSTQNSESLTSSEAFILDVYVGIFITGTSAHILSANQTRRQRLIQM